MHMCMYARVRTNNTTKNPIKRYLTPSCVCNRQGHHVSQIHNEPNEIKCTIRFHRAHVRIKYVSASTFTKRRANLHSSGLRGTSARVALAESKSILLARGLREGAARATFTIFYVAVDKRWVV